MPTKEQILEAAATSPEAKQALEKLFPEYFDKSKTAIEIFAEHIGDNDDFPYEWYLAMKGDNSYEKSNWFYETIIKPNLKK